MAVINKLILWLERVGLGLLVIGLILFWLDWQTEKRITAARLEGYAQCEAEFAKNEVKKSENENEVQNERNYKKAVIWSERAIDDDTTQRLYDNGIL